MVIEDDVEVQANSCIDRASVGETRIKRGVKIDNLVQVGHGSTVGEDALLCSQVGIAGSTEIGNRVILQNHVVIGGDGYGFAKRADGTHYKIVQSGITVIEDDVEIPDDPDVPAVAPVLPPGSPPPS